MKHLNNWIIALVMAFCGLMTSCKKESQNIFNMFDVALTLHNNNPKAVSGDVDVNPGDSLVFDFTITSPNKDMYMVCVHRAGDNLPYLKIPITDDAKRRSYSGTIDIVADRGVGKTTYRIWALDKEGVYLGDGYKSITINVVSDFRFMPNRKLYFPDTMGKQLNSYLSLAGGATYSYTTGASHSADIDLGIYRQAVYDPNTNEFKGYMHNLYSLSADPNPFVPYDVSSWTKRETLFSAPVKNSTNTFRNTLKTGKTIETEAKKKTINLKHIATGLVSNDMIYFVTPEGKYGVLIVNSITLDYQDKPFMDISVKIQD